MEATEEDNHLEEVDCSTNQAESEDNHIPLAVVVEASTIHLVEVNHNLVEASHILLGAAHILMVAYRNYPSAEVVVHNQLEADRIQLEVDRILLEVDHILQVASRSHPSQEAVKADDKDLLEHSNPMQVEDYL